MFIPSDAEEILNEIIESTQQVEDVFLEHGDYIDSKSAMWKLEQTEHYSMSLLRSEVKKLKLLLGLLEYRWCKINPQDFKGLLERDGDEYYFRYWPKGTLRPKSCNSIQVQSTIYWTLVDRSSDNDLMEYRITCRAIHEDFTRFLHERTVASKANQTPKLTRSLLDEQSRSIKGPAEGEEILTEVIELAKVAEELHGDLIYELDDQGGYIDGPQDGAEEAIEVLSIALRALPLRWCGLSPLLYTGRVAIQGDEFVLIAWRIASRELKGNSTFNIPEQIYLACWDWIECETKDYPDWFPSQSDGEKHGYPTYCKNMLSQLKYLLGNSNHKVDSVVQSGDSLTVPESETPMVENMKNSKGQEQLPVLTIHTMSKEIRLDGELVVLRSGVVNRFEALRFWLDHQLREKSPIDSFRVVGKAGNKPERKVYDIFKNTAIQRLLNSSKGTRGQYWIDIDMKKSVIL